MALDLCTVGDVKLAADVPDDSRDGIIQACVTAASRRLASRYQREFARADGTSTRRFAVTSARVNLAPRDLQSVDVMILDPDGSPTTLDSTDYRLLPRQSISGTFYIVQLRASLNLCSTTSSEFGAAELDITGTWGFETVPEDVARAAVVTAASWIDRAVTAYGIDSDGAPGGLAPDFASTWDIPFAAHKLCAPYARVVV